MSRGNGVWRCWGTVPSKNELRRVQRTKATPSSEPLSNVDAALGVWRISLSVKCPNPPPVAPTNDWGTIDLRGVTQPVCPVPTLRPSIMAPRRCPRGVTRTPALTAEMLAVIERQRADSTLGGIEGGSRRPSMRHRGCMDITILGAP